MYYSHVADINAGVVATIWWSVSILNAFLDYKIYGQKLLPHHMISMGFMILGGMLISFSKTQRNPEDVKSQNVQPWVPVLVAFICSITFSAKSMGTKYLTSEKVGFDA